MSTFRGAGALARAYLRQGLRSKSALLWNLAFPLLWLFVFGFIFAGNRSSSLGVLMPGLFTITIMSGAFFGVSYVLVSERESAILRRYRVTPLTAPAIVVANALRSLALLGVSLAVQAAAARLVFGIDFSGSLVSLVVMMLLGALAFVPLGLIVGSTAQDMRSAPAIANLLLFPMMFLSGAAFPAFLLPEWVQQLSRFVPATYLVEGLSGIMLRGETLADLVGPVVVLVVCAGVGTALSSLLFRWESSEPLDKRALAAALAGLIVLYVAAAFLAPDLRMTTPPPGVRTGATAEAEAPAADAGDAR